MSYIKIINNSENYIKMLKQKDIIIIKPSDNLVKRYDPLWGYYDVKFFIINKKISPNEVFPNHIVICGDFFQGESFLKKVNITRR